VRKVINNLRGKNEGNQHHIVFCSHGNKRTKTKVNVDAGKQQLALYMSTKMI
jgi:hypothetical protein